MPIRVGSLSRRSTAHTLGGVSGSPSTSGWPARLSQGALPMSDPALRDRLVSIVMDAAGWKRGKTGARNIADAILASEDWRQREVALALNNNLYVYGSPRATETLAKMLAHLVTAESLIYGDPEDVRI